MTTRRQPNLWALEHAVQDDTDEDQLFVVRRKIKGPLWWADAFCADRQGRYLSTHDDNTFGIGKERVAD